MKRVVDSSPATKRKRAERAERAAIRNRRQHADREILELLDVFLDLDDTELNLKPESLRQFLSRLRELLAEEIARRRPPNRPRTDTTGSLVATLAEIVGLPEAKRLVARMRKKPLQTVARAYERHVRRQK